MKKVSFLLMGVLSLSFACEKVKEGGEAAPTPPALGQELGETLPKETDTKETPSLNVANVVLYPRDGNPILLSVEVAKTAEEKRRGLQGRENLPEKHGMWFVFDEDVQEPFWMKDTSLSLDILFVDKDSNVVHIIPTTTPNSDLLLVPPQKYRYALEIKGGSALALKLNVGDRVEFRLGPP